MEYLDIIWHGIVHFLDAFWWAIAGAGAFFLLVFRRLSVVFTSVFSSLKKMRGENSSSTAKVAKKKMRYGGSPKQALLAATARLEQMRLYIEADMEIIHSRWGPYALTEHLHLYLNPLFSQKMSRFRERLQFFDSLEEKAQALIQQYDIEREALRRPWLKKIVRFRVLNKVGLAYQMNSLKRVKSCQSKRARALLYQTGKRIFWSHVYLWFFEAPLNRKYRVPTAWITTQVDLYCQEFLDDWMASFSADILSRKVSALSGNVRKALLDDQNASVRERLCLTGDLSPGGMRSALDAYNVPKLLNPDGQESSLETLFEMYLRVCLYLSHDMREAWGVNISYLDSVAAPGGLGISHAKFMQLPSSVAWCDHAALVGSSSTEGSVPVHPFQDPDEFK